MQVQLPELPHTKPELYKQGQFTLQRKLFLKLHISDEITEAVRATCSKWCYQKSRQLIHK